MKSAHAPAVGRQPRSRRANADDRRSNALTLSRFDFGPHAASGCTQPLIYSCVIISLA